jgi:DNA-binding MarR family transcriptional regulator
MARSKTSELKREAAITLPCMCANLRRAARVVGQLYDEALRPSGLRVSQFTLLQALTLAPGISQKRLAGLLEFDSTTLTRTLALLRKRGWLRSEAATDRRELRLFLTASGLSEYTRALPFWRAVQRRLRRELGDGDWNQAERAAMRITAVNLRID